VVKTILSGIYFLLWRCRLFLYEHKILPTKRVNAFVVSVGNLTVGGTGKTPVTLFLAQQYQAKGSRVGIVSRGYRGRYKAPVVVVSDGQSVLEPPQIVGDEPVMMARRLNGVPIVVSRDRVLGCQWLIDHFKIDLILLDDGFQHIRLHRDLNILLMDATQTNYFLLPKGPMREPIFAAHRANIVIVTRQDCASPPFNMPEGSGFDSPILQTSFYPVGLMPLKGGASRPISTLSGEPIIAVCGIGNPSAFIKMLEQLGAKIYETILFPDHHHYTEADMQGIGIKAKSLGAKTIITTEKDAIKIERIPAQMAPFEAVDIWALEIRISFLDPYERWGNLLFGAASMMPRTVDAAP